MGGARLRRYVRDCGGDGSPVNVDVDVELSHQCGRSEGGGDEDYRIRYVGRASMNKARDAESMGYDTNPSQMRTLLVKLLKHSGNVARSPGERISRTLRHNALHVRIPPGEGKAATKAFEVSRRDGVVWWGGQR